MVRGEGFLNSGKTARLDAFVVCRLFKVSYPMITIPH
jgi:hypothetical protein